METVGELSTSKATWKTVAASEMLLCQQKGIGTANEDGAAIIKVSDTEFYTISADGMGGHARGDFAMKVLLDSRS